MQLAPDHIHHCITCHQPNWWFNADANMGHAFGIFMAFVGALRTCGATVPLTWVLGFLKRNAASLSSSLL